VISAQVKNFAVPAAKPGRSEESRKLLEAMVEPSRGGPGNLRYDQWHDQDRQGRFVLDALYRGEDAIAAHPGSPRFRNYLSKIENLAERSTMSLSAVAVS
jgi:quinol monooxygenase YgiN